MNLSPKSLEQLRDLINEKTEYRNGPRLISFFGDLGLSVEPYSSNFGSRKDYTDTKLASINGTASLDSCLKTLFAPVNFVGRFGVLDKLISEFNQYLMFDGWNVVRNNTEITFKKAEKIEIKQTQVVSNEQEFMRQEFADVSLDRFGFDEFITKSLNVRIEEIRIGLSGSAPLSIIFLSGSTLEGVLFGIASANSRIFNQAQSSPKDKLGKVLQIPEWNLNSLIDTAYELGFLKEDVKKFSHVLRDFRNYIHPFHQAASRFHPDIHTAEICWQVLKAAIFQIADKQLNSSKT